MPTSRTVAHLAPTLLGVSTGLRSFTPLALTALFAQSGKLPVKGTWAEWLTHPAVVGILATAAVGEYVGDKLPNTSDRTAPLGLIGRLSLGGLVGAIIATAYKRPLASGIALGTLGAAAGTYGGFYARKGLSKGMGVNDVVSGVVGDSASVALALRSLRRLTA